MQYFSLSPPIQRHYCRLYRLYRPTPVFWAFFSLHLSCYTVICITFTEYSLHLLDCIISAVVMSTPGAFLDFNALIDAFTASSKQVSIIGYTSIMHLVTRFRFNMKWIIYRILFIVYNLTRWNSLNFTSFFFFCMLWFLFYSRKLRYSHEMVHGSYVLYIL